MRLCPEKPKCGTPLLPRRRCPSRLKVRRRTRRWQAQLRPPSGRPALDAHQPTELSVSLSEGRGGVRARNGVPVLRWGRSCRPSCRGVSVQQCGLCSAGYSGAACPRRRCPSARNGSGPLPAAEKRWKRAQMRSPKWAVRVAGRPAWESARRPRNSAGPDRRSRGEAVPARGLRWTTRSGCWRGLFRGLGDGSETGESTPAASSQASTPSAVAKWRTHPGATLARDAGPAVRIDEIPKPATSPSRTPLFPLHSPGNPSETAMAYPDTASAPLLPSSSAPAAPKSRSRAWCLALAGLAVLLPLVLIPAASVGGWEVSVETEIKGRPEQAWAVLQDVEGWPRWDVGLERAEVETPIVVGRVGKVHLKERGTFDITFVAADPPVPGPVRVVYRSEHTGAKMDWYWNFTPLNATAGAYGFRMGVEVSGPLASLYRAVIGKEAAESFAECVPLFKKCAEEQEV